jgi:hypothetical protein
MVPECALFEADGGTWKLDAVLTIKVWLEDRNLREVCNLQLCGFRNSAIVWF